MKAVTTKGTVKVGRWDYPAEQDESGTIRNTKRDGSGDWVPADADKFVPAAKPAAKPAKAKAATKAATVVPTGETVDRALLREQYRLIFDNFAVTADELRVNGISEKRGLELARYLEGTGLVVRSLAGESGKEPIWQSLKTYDNHDAEEVMADFDAAVPLDVVIKERKVAVRTKPPVNNTHKKPGRSTWQIGDPCAQGLHVLTAENRYEMPSGRVQCRDCRKGYPSNI